MTSAKILCHLLTHMGLGLLAALCVFSFATAVGRFFTVDTLGEFIDNLAIFLRDFFTSGERITFCGGPGFLLLFLGAGVRASGLGGRGEVQDFSSRWRRTPCGVVSNFSVTAGASAALAFSRNCIAKSCYRVI